VNAQPAVEAGAALMVTDADLSPGKIAELVVPLVVDAARVAAMSSAAVGLGHREADETLAKIVLEAAGA
jgi:UDP-N-acetylglucosamine--N-acetylmuramyl-(pentapeptide) pyrophosphoryl-undecaprenol N-acetylglucosamine transferase